MLKVARELGYSPNHTARALSTGRPANIALIVPDLINPFIPQLISGVQRAADAENHCVFIGNAEEQAETEARLLSRFIGQVAGAIIVSARSSEAQLRRFESELPVVLVNRDIDGMSRILVDSSQGMAEAAAHLSALGHRCICYLGGGKGSWSDAQRRAAIAHAAADLGLDLIMLAAGEVSFEGGDCHIELWGGEGRGGSKEWLRRTLLRARASSSSLSRAVLRMRRNDEQRVVAVWRDNRISPCTACYGSSNIIIYIFGN